MKINIALWDRMLRFLLGAALFAWGIAGGPWWTYFGLYFLATAAWRFCLAYAAFRVSTSRH